MEYSERKSKIVSLHNKLLSCCGLVNMISFHRDVDDCVPSDLLLTPILQRFIKRYDCKNCSNMEVREYLELVFPGLSL